MPSTAHENGHAGPSMTTLRRATVSLWGRARRQSKVGHNSFPQPLRSCRPVSCRRSLVVCFHNKADPSCGIVAIGDFPDLGPLTKRRVTSPCTTTCRSFFPKSWIAGCSVRSSKCTGALLFCRPSQRNVEGTDGRNDEAVAPEVIVRRDIHAQARPYTTRKFCYASVTRVIGHLFFSFGARIWQCQY